MKSKIVERLYGSYYISFLEIKCESCNHTLFFKADMLDYCSALYCHYCGFRMETTDIKEFLVKN